MRRLLCLVLLLNAFAELNAQQRLVLVKKNRLMAKFVEGDRIRLRCKHEDFHRTGIISGIQRDFIKLGENDTIYINKIERIDMRSHPNAQFKTAEAGRKFILAGVILVTIDALNSSNGGYVSNGVIVVSSVFVASGTLMQFVNNNYFKPGRNKKIAVLEEPPSK